MTEQKVRVKSRAIESNKANSGNCIDQRIAKIDWQQVIEDLLHNGYSSISKLLNSEHCEQLKKLYGDHSRYRKTVDMQRYRFGNGEYRYFKYPLPEIVYNLREKIYPLLVPVANAWMKSLKLSQEFPNNLEEFSNICVQHEQLLPTPLMLKYNEGGFNTLHQDLYGDVYFPIQLVINLSEPGTDFSGGELVLTEQIPRAQSRARVLQPGKGDMIIFASNFRPAKGTKGFYRVTMKHGVSEVIRGQRFALGIIFHDAKS